MITEKATDITPDLIAYRLDNIEQQLDQMNKIIQNNLLQDRDIKDLQNRMTCAEADIKNMKTEINTIKDLPIKNSAKRWNYILDYIFKGLVALGFGAVLYKLGIK